MEHRSLREDDAVSSAPLCERNDVVQLFWAGFKEATQIASRLADPLLVFHQRNAYETFPVFPETASRRNRELGLLDQKR
jgi:hypothetical protein